MNVFKQEFKRCLIRIEFKVVFFIVFVISMSAFIASCYAAYHSHLSWVRSAYETTIMQGTSTHLMLGVLLMLLPLLAPIIHADTLHNELESGVYKMVLLRTSLKRYVWSKAITIVVVTFFTFFIPLFINQLLCLMVFPMTGYESKFAFPPYDIGIQNYDPDAMLELLRLEHPLLYNVVFMILISVAASTMALFAYGVSFYLKKNRFVLFAGVFLFVTLCGIGLSLLSYQWTLTHLLTPNQKSDGWVLVIWLVAFTGIGLAAIWGKTKNNELGIDS